MAQWLRICLPIQGTQVWDLVWEDPTCRGAAKPVHHNYWACALEPVSHSYWAHVPQLLKPARLEPVLHNKRNHRNEKPAHCNQRKTRMQQQRPNAAKKIKIVLSKSVINLALFLTIIPLIAVFKICKCIEVKWKDREMAAFSTYLRYLGPVDFF